MGQVAFGLTSVSVNVSLGATLNQVPLGGAGMPATGTCPVMFTAKPVVAHTKIQRAVCEVFCHWILPLWLVSVTPPYGLIGGPGQERCSPPAVRHTLTGRSLPIRALIFAIKFPRTEPQSQSQWFASAWTSAGSGWSNTSMPASRSNALSASLIVPGLTGKSLFMRISLKCKRAIGARTHQLNNSIALAE
jgi:hypothetical protein